MRSNKNPADTKSTAAKDKRSARLAEALRANLARRKAQKRARSDETARQKNQDT